MGYKITCLVLSLIILAFAPGMIAAQKQRRFPGWYLYGVLLFPIALFHSIALKKPHFIINVLSSDKKDPTKRVVKAYTKHIKEQESPSVSFTALVLIFITKLIFGVLVAFAAFAISRVFIDDSDFLRIICGVFAIVFAIMLSIVQIFNLSLFPQIADEVTKRALIMAVISVVSSLPFFLIKQFVLDKLPFARTDFFLFICTFLSLALFLHLLIRLQQHYYAGFHRFGDYCVLSLFSYAIFAASTLILMSVTKSLPLIFTTSMPMQLFNLDYFSSVDHVKISCIYAAAIIHLFVAIILLYSGIMCYKFKRNDILFRTEYRAKAFNMTRKRILRRSVPQIGVRKTTSIYNA